VIIAGKEERERGELVWKDMVSGEQISMKEEELLAKLLEERKKC